VSHALYRSLRQGIAPVAFTPFTEKDQNGVSQPASYGTFVVHTTESNPPSLAKVLLRKIADLRSGLRFSNFRTQASVVRAQTVRESLW
jgi:hypothetical protein